MRSTTRGRAGFVAGLTALVGVAVGLASLSGCGEEKKLPTAEGGTDTNPATPANVVPAESEEPARKAVERAIKAMTDGHPERAEKTKVNKSTAKGHYRKPVGGQLQFVETNRVIQAVYPDRLRADYDFRDEGYQLTIGLRRPTGVWAKVSAGQPPVFDPQQFADLVTVDALGTHWFLTLTPLTDSKTVVYGLSTANDAGKPHDTLKASIRGFPVVFTLWFEQATARPARVVFQHLEAGVPVTKVVTLAEHKPFGGLTLPTKIVYTRDDHIAEQWTIESWEFPDRIDEAVFEQPK